MATYILPRRNKVTTPQVSYYVVSKGFAGKLQGYNNSCTATKGTLYGVFATFAKAQDFVNGNNLKRNVQILTVSN